MVNNRGELKITDFGLARPIEENRIKYTPGVVTRWYRPPELLFGSDIYDESIDIWGVGCIIAEMYMRKPLFGASGDLDQLKMVCFYCGTPTEETYPGVGKLPDFSKVQLKPEKRILKDFLESKHIDKEAIDLIDQMLMMDPKKRITAKEALEHEYFTSDPLPCLPSEIEKFESSHVYTVQQQKEKEMAMMGNKRNRYEDHEDQQNSKRGNGHRYMDYDARDHEHGSRHSRSHERIKYSDRLTPPPPPPPPPIERERERERDYDKDSRDHRDYRGHGDREYRRRDHRDLESYGHRHNERRDRHEHDRTEHHNINDVPTERRVFSSSATATPQIKRHVTETPPPAAPKSSLELSRRTVLYDDL